MSHVADSHHGSPSYIGRCQKVTTVSTVRVGLTIPKDKLNIAYVQMERTAFIHNSCHQKTSLETSKATRAHYHVHLYH